MVDRSLTFRRDRGEEWTRAWALREGMRARLSSVLDFLNRYRYKQREND